MPLSGFVDGGASAGRSMNGNQRAANPGKTFCSGAITRYITGEGQRNEGSMSLRSINSMITSKEDDDEASPATTRMRRKGEVIFRSIRSRM